MNQKIFKADRRVWSIRGTVLPASLGVLFVSNKNLFIKFEPKSLESSKEQTELRNYRKEDKVSTESGVSRVLDDRLSSIKTGLLLFSRGGGRVSHLRKIFTGTSVGRRGSGQEPSTRVVVSTQTPGTFRPRVTGGRVGRDGPDDGTSFAYGRTASKGPKLSSKI